MRYKTTVAAFAICSMLGACGNGEAGTSAAANDVAAAPPAAPVHAGPVEPPKPVFAWTYNDRTDQMRGTTESFAQLSSSNVVQTNWPYDQSPMRMTIRRRAEDGVNVMLHINGQFLCNSYGGSTQITVKFDDGPLEKFRCVEGSSGPNDTIFIEPETRFINRIKASKVMMVEAPIYEIGRAQVSFPVEGLEWE